MLSFQQGRPRQVPPAGTRERDTRVIEARMRGWTAPQIADAFQLSVYNVRMILSMWRHRKGRFAE